MIVLGVDPGFTITGFSIVSKINGKDIILDSGCFSFSTTQSLPMKIGTFYQKLSEKIIKYQVTIIAIETPFLGKNVQTFLKLGYLRGVLYLLSQQHNLVLHEFSPREVKLAITGFGGAQKEQVAKVLSLLFPQLGLVKKADISDAIAIGLCGLWKRNPCHSFFK
ncbi:crossover junction endodeoxyribonuclease RuvC [Candidatus Dependentiae bacterium]|nr:crossover junction endodeoxyribonuclease RuvC [Candidatus Dependentiae bacterium]